MRLRIGPAVRLLAVYAFLGAFGSSLILTYRTARTVVVSRCCSSFRTFVLLAVAPMSALVSFKTQVRLPSHG